MNRKRLLRASFALTFCLLLLHEMDAVSWKEWRLFGVQDDTLGRHVFLAVHLPLLLSILWILARLSTRVGQIVSLLLGGFLMVHLGLHYGALDQGYLTDGFSFGIVVAIFASALVQSVVSAMALLSVTSDPAP